MTAPERAGAAAAQTCLVTGTGGYLGSCVRACFRERGWRVISLTRRPAADPSAIRFQLGSEIAASVMAGARALVHCAYDFRQVSARDAHRVNVGGTERLIRSALEAKVSRLIYISTISAYEGCRSIYGKTKLEAEKLAESAGAVVIRPGLIHGDVPRSTFGQLVAQVERSTMQPLFGGGSQIQYLVHEADLANFICDCAEERIRPASGPITIAHKQPWRFRELLEELARARGKSLRFLPVPWRAAWAALRCAELCKVPIDLRSDSLLSLMFQNPAPSFDALDSLTVACRPFRPPVTGTSHGPARLQG